MINSIITAISEALNAEFGDGYTIYTEEIEQGLQEPCFFVFCLNPSRRPLLTGRYLAENQFCLQYFPVDRGRAREECNAVAERLYTCLEYISVAGELKRGTAMRFEVLEGVMSFFVNYNIFLYKQTAVEAMNELAQAIKIKE